MEYFHIGNKRIPLENPKELECTKEYLEHTRFSCDNCSSLMSLKKGKHGHFLACPNWRTNKKCHWSTITVKLKQD